MNTGDGPKIFWSVTFLESLRNQGQLIRIWDTTVTVGHKIVKLATKSAVSLIASLGQRRPFTIAQTFLNHPPWVSSDPDLKSEELL